MENYKTVERGQVIIDDTHFVRTWIEKFEKLLSEEPGSNFSNQKIFVHQFINFIR
jgi:hypothetical protein